MPPLAPLHYRENRAPNAKKSHYWFLFAKTNVLDDFHSDSYICMAIMAVERIEKLRKTSAEQALLRNIQALEFRLAEETDSENKKSLQQQIIDLRQAISMVQGESYGLLQERNEELKARVVELERKLSAAMRGLSNVGE